MDVVRFVGATKDPSRSNLLDQPGLVIVGRLAVDVLADVTLFMLREIHQSVSLLEFAMFLEVAYLAQLVPASSAWRWMT